MEQSIRNLLSHPPQKRKYQRDIPFKKLVLGFYTILCTHTAADFLMVKDPELIDYTGNHKYHPDAVIVIKDNRPDFENRGIWVNTWDRSATRIVTNKIQKAIEDTGIETADLVPQNGASEPAYWVAEDNPINIITRGRLGTFQIKHQLNERVIDQILSCEKVKDVEEIDENITTLLSTFKHSEENGTGSNNDPISKRIQRTLKGNGGDT